MATSLFETVGSDVSQHLVRASKINFTLGGINFLEKLVAMQSLEMLTDN